MRLRSSILRLPFRRDGTCWVENGHTIINGGRNFARPFAGLDTITSSLAFSISQNTCVQMLVV